MQPVVGRGGFHCPLEEQFSCPASRDAAAKVVFVPRVLVPPVGRFPSWQPVFLGSWCPVKPVADP